MNPADSGSGTVVAEFLKEIARNKQLNRRLDSLAKRWPRLAESEELRQMILVRAWEHRDEFRGSTFREFWAWLSRLAWSIGVDLWRQQSRRNSLYRRLADLFRHTGSAGESRLETKEFVEWLIAGLNERERKALELKYFRGLRPRKAANRMGISIEAFNQLHHRAISKLRDRVAKDTE
jgi:RNA polymerase sigma factor (sigma-70 family)